MGLLIALVIAFLIYRALTRTPDTEEVDNKYVEVIEHKKVCPPHKWNYVEVKDKEGNTVKWKIVCDLCGPISGHDRPQNNGDYS